MYFLLVSHIFKCILTPGTGDRLIADQHWSFVGLFDGDVVRIGLVDLLFTVDACQKLLLSDHVLDRGDLFVHLFCVYAKFRLDLTQD